MDRGLRDGVPEGARRREVDLFLGRPIDLARLRAVLRGRLRPTEPLPVM